MKNRHEEVLNSAKEWLSTVDRDEFINDLLELQKQSTGPTIDDFLLAFTNPTASLFGLADSITEKPFFDDLPLPNNVSPKISRTSRNEAIASFRKTVCISLEGDFIAEFFNLKGKAIRNNSDDFCVNNTDISLCKVA